MIAQEILKTKKCLHELDVWAITAYIQRVPKKVFKVFLEKNTAEIYLSI